MKLTLISSLLIKKLTQLQKKLEPSAEFHASRDVAMFQREGMDVVLLVRGLPCAEELEEDINIAAKFL